MFPDLTRDDVFRIETRRLWLRWPCAADVPAIVRLAGEAAPAPMPAGMSPDGATEFVLRSRGDNTEGRSLTMAVAPRGKPRQLIGIVSIGPSGDDGHSELGCWIGRSHRDEGYGTEAARSLVDAFFAYTDGRELAASAQVVDPAWRRVLEACGFGPAEFRLDRAGWLAGASRPFADRAAAVPPDSATVGP